MRLNIRLENAEELLQLLNRAATLSTELEETLQRINILNFVSEFETSGPQLLDTSEGSITDDVLKLVTLKLQTVLEKLS